MKEEEVDVDDDDGGLDNWKLNIGLMEDRLKSKGRQRS
jgi:hypothetical protein